VEINKRRIDMKINIWIAREDVWELECWLKTSWDKHTKMISFFHDKPVEKMDLIQVTINMEEYRKILDNNEVIQGDVAAYLGWTQTTTEDTLTSPDQLNLFN
tara:strand:- start:35 stop:340 length:306 start_codon:yes stop_codon:yes gene_type:complete